jgi:hypothetical protein
VLLIQPDDHGVMISLDRCSFLLTGLPPITKWIMGASVLGWMWAVCVNLMLAIYLGSAVTGQLDRPKSATELVIYSLAILLLVPVVENFILTRVYEFSLKLTTRRLVASLAGLVPILALHEYFARGWGLAALGPFVLMLLVYDKFRSESTYSAYWATVVIHGVINLPAAAIALVKALA